MAEAVPDANGDGGSTKPQGIAARLTGKLKSLLPTASKETLQTHANWILFHSKRHSNALCMSLLRELARSEQDEGHLKRGVYLNIIHETLMMNNPKATVVSATHVNVGKWERNSEFRLRLGELVLRPFLEEACSRKHTINASLLESMVKMMSAWKNVDCFCSPTLFYEISRMIDKLKNDSVSKTGSDEENSPMKCEEPSPVKVEDVTAKSVCMDIDKEGEQDEIAAIDILQTPQNDVKETEEPKMQVNQALTTTTATDDVIFSSTDHDVDMKKENKDRHSESLDKSRKEERSMTANNQVSLQQKEFDFESEGIPQCKVEVQKLQAPCKSIATMQITRDLHSDTAHNVSSVLSNVPDEVMEACQNAAADNSADEIDLSSIPPIPDELLNLNLKQILSNIRSHRDIITKQQEARKTLMNLLIQSRCQFGSQDAASMYYGMRETMDRLKKRKSNVLDAMELEGLDFDRIDGDNDKDGIDKGQAELKDLEWFSREQADTKRDSKMSKVA